MYYHFLIHYFISLLIGSVFCIGLWISRDGELNENGSYKWKMIFYPLFVKLKDKEWAKPIIGCYICYASFWGTIMFTLSSLFAIRTNFIPLDYVILIPMWVIYCFSLVVVNVLIEKPTREK